MNGIIYKFLFLALIVSFGALISEKRNRYVILSVPRLSVLAKDLSVFRNEFIIMKLVI